ncbi:uncharacterized protein MONBRDRAFT_26553 [Monosiga brevicollis MX1]|uniref:Uncharacterized protein n=1 Tax=Monosiga brevicollis TaxID=81824 RepID=A9V2Q0_MONBE|nr:uncharacterized protein MONBRDRAFT_26553 [Monosiga brevicollis MX1]EDQ88411.1 predicted protein [Monosiga brevicollis MX1]|eukprot:XP_001747004.1 hypothetical protein [Monosiga brevicollis MX1]
MAHPVRTGADSPTPSPDNVLEVQHPHQQMGHEEPGHVTESQQAENGVLTMADEQGNPLPNPNMINMGVHVMMADMPPPSMASDDLMTGALSAFEAKFPRAKPPHVTDGSVLDLLKQSRCWNKHDIDVILSNIHVRRHLDKLPISKQLFNRAITLYQHVQRVPFSQELPPLPTATRSRHRYICLACERHHGLPSTIRHIGSTMPCTVKSGLPDWHTWRPCPWAIFGADFIARCLRPMKNLKRKADRSSPDPSYVHLDMGQPDSGPAMAHGQLLTTSPSPKVPKPNVDLLLSHLRDIESNEVQRHASTMHAISLLRNEMMSLTAPASSLHQDHPAIMQPHMLRPGSMHGVPLPGHLQHMTAAVSSMPSAMPTAANYMHQPPIVNEAAEPEPDGQDEPEEPQQAAAHPPASAAVEEVPVPRCNRSTS